MNDRINIRMDKNSDRVRWVVSRGYGRSLTTIGLCGDESEADMAGREYSAHLGLPLFTIDCDGLEDEIVPASVASVAKVLLSYGDRFSGGDSHSAIELATEWVECGFDAIDADEWCEIGVWDSGVALCLRDDGVTPEQTSEAAGLLGREDVSRYTDGCPIYSACNSDTSVDVIIRAAKRLTESR